MSDINVALIVVAAAVTAVLLVGNVYFLIHMQHKDDKYTVLPKALFVIGLTLCEGTILLFPLDVANKAGIVGCLQWNNQCGGLHFEVMWQVAYIAIAAFVLVLIPVTIFYYEADDSLEDAESRSSWRICTALKYEIVTLLVSIGVCVIMYVYLNETAVPIRVIALNATTMFTDFTNASLVIVNGSFANGTVPSALLPSETPCLTARGLCPLARSTLTMTVSFAMYIIALLSFVGWFFFVFFGSVGLSALPVDLIMAFRNRPQPMKLNVYAAEKKKLAKRTSDLLALAKSVQSNLRARGGARSMGDQKSVKKINKLSRAGVNQLNAAVLALEQEWEDLQLCYEISRANPLVPWVQLFAGIFCSLLTILWLLQILLYMLPQTVGRRVVSLFMNEYFIWFDSWFPALGTISVGVMAMYLLICTVKGNAKLGMRIFLFSIHPMKVGRTLINSLLFNLSLVLLCAVPVVQFSSQAFADYARLTDLEVIFGAQIRYLKFFTWFFDNNVFIFALGILCVLSFFFSLICPSKRKITADDIRKRIATARRRGEDPDEELRDMA